MKKKLAIMFIVGAFAAGLTACGNKADSSTLETEVSTEVSTEASTVVSDESSENEATEIEWVSEREDYIGLQDLDIDKYITLCDYANMTVNDDETGLIENVVEESEINEIPQWLVDEQIQYYTLYLEREAAAYGYDLESFIEEIDGVTFDEYIEGIGDEFIDTIKSYLAVEAIARAEGIELTEDDVKAQANTDYAGYGYESAESFLQNVGYTTYRVHLLQDLVEDRLAEIVNVEQ
jgi:FKBP-type peptidyl-prolyl cis-trans isomerase (trigger factor)